MDSNSINIMANMFCVCALLGIKWYCEGKFHFCAAM